MGTDRNRPKKRAEETNFTSLAHGTDLDHPRWRAAQADNVSASVNETARHLFTYGRLNWRGRNEAGPSLCSLKTATGWTRKCLARATVCRKGRVLEYVWFLNGRHADRSLRTTKLAAYTCRNVYRCMDGGLNARQQAFVTSRSNFEIRIEFRETEFVWIAASKINFSSLFTVSDIGNRYFEY